MRWRNTERRYGGIAKSLHWLIAVLVLALTGVGLYMVRMDLSPAMFTLFFWHKAVGITVLILAVLRIGWRLYNRPPQPVPSHQPWEKAMAKIIHYFFYIALIWMPLSGWVMSSAKDFSVSFYGWFTLPDLVAPNESVANIAGLVHSLFAYMLIAAIILHIAGSLKHHIVDKDSTLRRMLPFGRVDISDKERVS